jgi:DNA-binding NtrC family response regulator
MPGRKAAERPRLAVIDDEPIVRREISRNLRSESYDVEAFADGEVALRRLGQVEFDVVLCDLRLPGVGGMEVLKAVQATSPDTEVIIMTGYSSVDSAIDAIRAGAYHYVTKPVKTAELKLLLRRALDKVALVRDRDELRQALATGVRPPNMIGTSRPIQQVFDLVHKVAPLDCTVLIQGESGTGKEMVARALHREGPRRSSPFISFNCGGFTEELIANELFGHERGAFTGATASKSGLLEVAHGGSVLLDEIGEMPPSMQVKLLRFVEDRQVIRVGGVKPRPVDVRLIAASHRDLREMVSNQTFREDLFYRLNVVVIALPPLRERLDDLPLLVEHFLEKYRRHFDRAIEGFSEPALEALARHPFPGNVRELENIVERAVALTDGSQITLGDLPPEVQGLSASGEEIEAWPTLEQSERDYIQRVLLHTGGRRGKAAEILGIPRTTLWRKMTRHGLS